MSETGNIIKEQFSTLPKVIQDTILDSKWQEKIRRVVTNNKLHIDQGAAIENLVLITMLGIETPETFVKRAQEYANVSAEQAYNISAQVEREIFGDIRKKLIEATDGAGTVAEIDKATNELGKVSAAIEAAARNSTRQKPSLKDKIPQNYFEKNDSTKIPPIEIKTQEITPITIPAPIPVPVPVPVPIITEPKIDIYKEPIEISEKLEKIEDVEDVVISEPEIEAFEVPQEIKMSPPPKSIDIEMKVEEEPVSKLPPKPIFIPMPKTIDSIKPLANTSPSTAQVDPYRESVE